MNNLIILLPFIPIIGMACYGCYVWGYHSGSYYAEERYKPLLKELNNDKKLENVKEALEFFSELRNYCAELKGGVRPRFDFKATPVHDKGYEKAKEALIELIEFMEGEEVAEWEGFINGVNAVANYRPPASVTHDGAEAVNQIRNFAFKKTREAQAAINVVKGDTNDK